MTLTIDQRIALARKRVEKRAAEVEEALCAAIVATQEADRAMERWKRAQERALEDAGGAGEGGVDGHHEPRTGQEGKPP